MDTPIVDFVKKYADNRPIRLHMPGHKGIFKENCLFDITEIDGADSLYTANGIIAKSQSNATELFESRKTFYSCEGSSLAIRAMLAIATFGKKKPLILACRNAHKAFLTAVALLDFSVSWINGDSILGCFLTANQLENELKKCERLPCAVYVTSPDYLGHMLDIKALSQVCHSFGTMLIVDNAHGSYLKFLTKSYHPLDLGADMCCDSAHKTLPVLTGGAYLHISKNAPNSIEAFATEMLGLFGSTSPSYLILQSLDLANKYIFENKCEFGRCSAKVELLKKLLMSKGCELYGEEQWKITLKTKTIGYFGEQLYNYFKSNNIISEYYDKDHLTMMFTPLISDVEFSKLEEVISHLKVLPRLNAESPKMPITERVLSVRQAYFSKKKRVNIDVAENLILAEPSVVCPPAVSILMCGEKINKEHIEMFKYYGINSIIVVDEK